MSLAVGELARVVRTGGVVVSVSRVLEKRDMLRAFAGGEWQVLRDGEMCFADEGEASTDLGAALFAFQKVEKR